MYMVFSSNLTAEQKIKKYLHLIQLVQGYLNLNPDKLWTDLLQTMPENVTRENKLEKPFVLNMTDNNCY